MAAAIGLLPALLLSFGQSPSLDALLARAGQAAAAFHRDAGQLAARESYEQRFHATPAATWTTQSVRSEFVMVADEPAATWHGYRDLLEIDGRRLRPGEDGRLERALRGSPPANFIEAQRITNESATQLLAGAGRATNAPAFGLMVLLPAHQARFAFTMRGEKRVGDVAARVIRFRERQGPMFFRDAVGREIPMTGELWIDPQSGAVLRLQFAIESASTTRAAGGAELQQPLGVALAFSRMSVDVSFRPDASLGVAVPVEMREIFSREMATAFNTPTLGATAGTRYWTQQLSCVATYSNHRRVGSGYH